MTILTIILAFAIEHFLPAVQNLRRFEWLSAIQQMLNKSGADIPAALRCVLLLLVPLLLLLIVNLLVTDWLGELSGFLLGLAVLLYCMGSRDLSSDSQRIITAGNDNELTDALRPILNNPLAEQQLQQNEQVIRALFRAGLQRWFTVALWFLILGIYGALLYRLCSWFAQRNSTEEQTAAWLANIQHIMEWPAAQLMTLAIALAADFDTVLKAWQRYLKDKGHGLQSGDSGFMLLAAVVAIQGENPAGVGVSNTLNGPTGTVYTAMQLLQRVLIVWLTLLIVILLASWLL